MVNEDLAKRDVMFKIGKLWREYRCKLWNEFYDPVLSRNDLIKNVPDGLNMEQWAIFVDYRLKPSTVVHTFHLIYFSLNLILNLQKLISFYCVETV